VAHVMSSPLKPLQKLRIAISIVQQGPYEVALDQCDTPVKTGIQTCCIVLSPTILAMMQLLATSALSDGLTSRNTWSTHLARCSSVAVIVGYPFYLSQPRAGYFDDYRIVHNFRHLWSQMLLISPIAFH
jgi:hypothetical protein